MPYVEPHPQEQAVIASYARIRDALRNDGRTAAGDAETIAAVLVVGAQLVELWHLLEARLRLRD